MIIYIGISFSLQGLFWRVNMGLHIYLHDIWAEVPHPCSSTHPCLSSIEFPKVSFSVSHIGTTRLYKWLYMLESLISRHIYFYKHLNCRLRGKNLWWPMRGSTYMRIWRLEFYKRTIIFGIVLKKVFVRKCVVVTTIQNTNWRSRIGRRA